MLADGRLVFDTKINTQGFETDLSTLERKAGSVTGSVAKGTLLADGLRKAGEELVEFGKDSLMSASQIQEVHNVIDTVFGDNADQIYTWAKAAKKNYGIAEGAALTYAGRFGTLFKTAGLADEQILQYTKDLVGLGGDFASFFDNDIEVALSKINSALKGETEAIDDYGIDVRIAALTDFMGKEMKGASQMEQLAAIYAKLMTDSSFVQGDFLKTQDSFANQLRILDTNIQSLKTTLGEGLLPLANGFVSAINSIFEGGEKDPTQSKLQVVAEQWTTFSEAVSASGEQFTQNQEKIAASADLAEKYLLTIETLEDKEIKTDEDVAAIQNAIAALNTLYPELQLYFDPATGKINENTQAIRENINALQALAVQNLFSQQQQENANAYAQALNNLADAQVALDEAKSPLANVETQISGLENLLSQLEENQFSGVNSLYGQLAGQVQGFDQYFEKNLDGSWSAKDGVIVDIGQITNSIQNELTALNIERDALLQGIADAQAAVDGYNASIEAIFSQQAEIEAKQARVLELMNGAGQAATGEYAAGVTDATGTAESAVSVMTSSAAASTDKSSYYSAGKGAAHSFVAGLKSVSIPVLRAKTSSFSVNTDGSHATGLNYVPYNDYIARLHVGEAVLTASEASKWRSGNSGIDSAAIGASIAAAITSAENRRPIVFQINGKDVARIMAGDNVRATTNYNKRIAMGVGK